MANRENGIANIEEIREARKPMTFKEKVIAAIGGFGLIALLTSLWGRGGKAQAASSGALQTGRVYVRNGVLHGPTGSVRLTSTDKLWLARAIVGEVTESATRWQQADTQLGGKAVAWALAQNLMLVGSSPPRMSSFTSLIRAYCQPVNPLWSRNGAKCTSGNYPDHCTESKLQRRARISSLSWAQIPSQVRSIVDSFWAGTLENPVSGLVDWHANSYSGAQVQIAGNWFGTKTGRTVI